VQKKFEIIYSIDDIDTVSAQLINHFDPLKIYCFTGNLGSGKTTLIRSICHFLGSVDNINSPTFSIVNEYSIPDGSIYHFDLYRLKNLEEAMDIGFEEYIYSGEYCFIEWPEKVADILPPSLAVHCELSYLSTTERKISAWLN